ncbi:MAG: SDR family NAD(P)-dependent oxidoreductase [Longimicrobiales bacterium]
MTDGDRQRVALVTGGAVRVGRAISLGLARAGYDLVVAYRSSSSQAETLAQEVAELDRTLVHVEADLGEAHAADRLIDAVRTSSLSNVSSPPPLSVLASGCCCSTARFSKFCVVKSCVGKGCVYVEPRKAIGAVCAAG